MLQTLQHIILPHSTHVFGLSYFQWDLLVWLLAGRAHLELDLEPGDVLYQEVHVIVLVGEAHHLLRHDRATPLQAGDLQLITHATKGLRMSLRNIEALDLRYLEKAKVTQ